jgi:hypothetical protein
MRALTLIAVGLYLCSWIARSKAGTTPNLDTLPVSEEHELLAGVR